MGQTVGGPARRRRTATIVAVAWFEVMGFASLGLLLWLAPFCWGSNCEGAGVSELFRNGSLALTWIGVQAAIGGGCIVLWRVTRDHPIIRGAGFVALGLAGALVVVQAVLSDQLVGFAGFLWLGVPALLLMAVWLPAFGTGWRSTHL